MQISVADLPLLLPLAFDARWPGPLGSLPVVDKVELTDRAPNGAYRSEETRDQVRALLRAGGHKPSGRGKPASEYLLRAAEQTGLPQINPAVDVLNVVSMISGIPISVVDLDLIAEPLSIRNGEEEEEYVFNASDQTIALKGLLSLCDAKGPCANAVKDSQRTKTSDGSVATLQILWAPKTSESIAQAALAWYMEEVKALGGQVTPIAIS